MKEFAGYLAIAGFFLYIANILRGKIRPVLQSWLIFSGLNGALWFGMAQNHKATPHIAFMTVGACVVLILSCRYGVREWDGWNAFCAAGGLAGAILMVVAAPTTGLVIVGAVVCAGSFPTFRSAYKEPERESLLCWCVFCVSSAFAILAVQWPWKTADIVQPLAFFFNQFITIAMILAGYDREPYADR